MCKAKREGHECTESNLTIFPVGSGFVNIVGHVFNQCNVNWKSKRPTCCTNIHVKSKRHGIQIIRRVVDLKWILNQEEKVLQTHVQENAYIT